MLEKLQSIPVSKKRIQSPKSRIPSWWNCAICNSCALQKHVEIRWSSLEFLQTVCVTYSLRWTTNSWWDCAIYRPLHALLSKLSCVIAPSITVTLSRNEETFLGISAYTWHFHAFSLIWTTNCGYMTPDDGIAPSIEPSAHGLSKLIIA